MVNAAVVKRAASSTQLTLPGNITPITEAYIFARAAGYLKRRYVDIGDRVHTGQKLADIEAPDLDQQVSQAEAALAQAQGQLGQAQATLEQLTATRDLAEITWQRYKILTAKGAVSRQDGDNQSTAAKHRQSECRCATKDRPRRPRSMFARARRRWIACVRCKVMSRSPLRLTAIITARNVDVGALISATGSTSRAGTAQCRGSVRCSERWRNFSPCGDFEAARADRRAANLCTGYRSRPGGDGHGAAAPRAELQGNGDAHLQLSGCSIQNAADRSRC